MLFWAKVVISSTVIVLASHLAGKKPLLAGFIVTLPFISVLSLTFAYIEHRDMQKINDFSRAVVGAVPLSLTFFIPFFANRWLKMNFLLSFSLGAFCLAFSYGLTYLVLKK